MAGRVEITDPFAQLASITEFLYFLAQQNGGELRLSLAALNAGRPEMGGVDVEFDSVRGEVVIKTVSLEQKRAMFEKQYNGHKDH